MDRHLAKGGGPKKRFQYCLNPNSSKHFLYFRAIQGHSGGTLVDTALQDNVLLPHDFAEYIYHIGNVSEIHSIIRSGLIPGERSLKRRQTICVFHHSENDGRRSRYGRNSVRLGQAKDSHHTKILGDLIKTQCIGAIISSLKRKDCFFLSNTITRSRPLQHTACELY